ncbi:MAG: serine/threonine protein kinase, partial [Planctomycetes bacterium]|nr:serine/threonine protein kinase [Planctomycetota bacterium]
MSDPLRATNLRDLFVEGVELGHEDRCAFVDRVRQRDAALAEQLVDLLQLATDGLGGFLAEPIVAAGSGPLSDADDVDVAPRAPEPPLIDGYVEPALIGRGGIGEVYRATQRTPIRRQVAIKVIRTGMDSRAVLRRFEAERLALARMAHPFIATVHDAGTDDRGRPFLVMEYVDGPPITTFCMRHAMTLEQRIELCAKVADAVDHAHRRGVLHRDLKPSNVLVVDVDGVPTPKVIDFGI